VSGLQGPIDENEQRESLLKQISIREDIKAIMKKQKEEEKERNKALQEQIQAIVEKQKQEDNERKKALQEQIDAIIQKQKEEDEDRKRSVKEKLVARMEMVREEHIKKHHPDRIHDQFEFMQDVEVRKGFLKFHILGVLISGPTHGYEIMHRISHHTGHVWRPSPGSMYPALESLEKEGFITCQGDGRRKVYSLTSKGENIMDQVQKKQQEQFLEMKAFLSGIFHE
jgi:DNA-binding PadR family transcriptional regulator